jgi:hypothetical protein
MNNFIIEHLEISYSNFSNEFFIGLFFTLILSLTIRFVYQLLLSEKTYSDYQFSNSTFLVTICTYVIVYIVKESITLSLGLVGALSIVRFRTPIKDPFELSIFFVSIAVGISNAVFQYIPSIFLTVLLIIYLFYLSIKRGVSVNNLNFINKNLEKSFSVEINSKDLISLDKLINGIKSINVIKIISISNVDNEMSLNIQVTLKNYNELELLKNELDSFKDLNYHINEN